MKLSNIWTGKLFWIPWGYFSHSHFWFLLFVVIWMSPLPSMLFNLLLSILFAIFFLLDVKKWVNMFFQFSHDLWIIINTQAYTFTGWKVWFILDLLEIHARHKQSRSTNPAWLVMNFIKNYILHKRKNLGRYENFLLKTERHRFIRIYEAGILQGINQARHWDINGFTLQSIYLVNWRSKWEIVRRIHT